MDNNLIRKVEWINIGLMILCAFGARFFPFELLVGSFLILGPAHYLTQISWMRDRNYFVASKQVGLWGWMLPFGFLWVSALGMSSDPITPLLIFGILCCFWMGYSWACLDPYASVSAKLFKIFSVLAFAFLTSIAFYTLRVDMVFISSRPWLIFAIPFSLGILLPTVLHVFAFTAAFMLSGYRKSNEPVSLASFLVLLSGSILLMMWPMEPQEISSILSPTLNFFNPLVELMTQHGMFNQWYKVSDSPSPQSLPYFSSQIASVLAFIYTYHYLNWFSKVEILRWNKMNRPRFIGVLACYVGVLSIMAFSFGTGLVLAIYLANVHMLLEIPLDMRVILGLFSRQDPPGS